MAHLLWLLGLLAAAQPVYKIPLQVLPSRHIAVMARIDGAGPFRLILDTGSPVSLVDNRIARAARLVAPSALGQPAMMGLRGFADVKRLQVGDLTDTGLQVLVFDHPTVTLLSDLEGPIDGILGFTFFSHYRMSLDYAHGWLTLQPISYRPPDVMTDLMGRLTAGPPARIVVQPDGVWGMVVGPESSGRGVRVLSTIKGGAAEAAGLQAGDRLLTIGGRWTDSVLDCYRAASYAPADQPVQVQIQRGGQRLTLTVTPALGV